MCSNVQVRVALHKERHPEQYCPTRKCLWRTGGGHCPRHYGAKDPFKYPKEGSRMNRETRRYEKGAP